MQVFSCYDFTPCSFLSFDHHLKIFKGIGCSRFLGLNSSFTCSNYKITKVENVAKQEENGMRKYDFYHLQSTQQLGELIVGPEMNNVGFGLIDDHFLYQALHATRF